LWDGPAAVRLTPGEQQLDCVVEPLVVDRVRAAQVVEPAQHRVVPMPRIREMRESLGNDLAGLVGAIEPMREHELGRTHLRILERALPHRSLLRRNSQVLEDVEGRVERAVRPFGVVADVAVRAAVCELRSEHGFGERSQAWVVGNEVRAEPEPEAEVTEIDAPEQERDLRLLAAGHEAIEQALERYACGRVTFRQAT